MMSVSKGIGGLVLAAIVAWSLGTAATAWGEAIGKTIKYGVDLQVIVEGPEASVPAALTLPADVATHHAEVIARFTEGNPYGGVPGSFFPYLKVKVSFVHKETGRSVERMLHPLAHSHDPGFHYGANVRLPQKGGYTVSVTVDPPSDWEVGRHDDVKGWFEPITMSAGYTWR